MWLNATDEKPCRVCNRPNDVHKSKWCITAPDGTATICPFTPMGAKRYIDGSGYLHVFDDSNGYGGSSVAVSMRKQPRPSPPRVVDWETLQWFYSSKVDDSDVHKLADSLGVDMYPLYRLGVGYAGDQTWTFPMYDGNQKIIGIRKRCSTGKSAVYGSRNGLFMVGGWIGDSVVIICEGPTDTAYALQIGFNAVGRASCGTGESILVDLLKGREAVVVADSDDVGVHYAGRLAARLNCPVVLPARGKDLRAWQPSRQEFLESIESARKVMK